MQTRNSLDLLIRLGLSVSFVLLLSSTSRATLAQVPARLSFSTDGAGASTFGLATSSNGALRGTVKFKFNGLISNGLLRIDATRIEPALVPGASALDEVWVSGYYGNFNQTGKPQITFTPGSVYDTLTISNLAGGQGFSRTSGWWRGKVKMTLRFSKIPGVADQFSVEFTPESPQYNPPRPVSGLISSATVQAGSDLILVR